MVRRHVDCLRTRWLRNSPKLFQRGARSGESFDNSDPETPALKGAGQPARGFSGIQQNQSASSAFPKSFCPLIILSSSALRLGDFAFKILNLGSLREA